MHFFFFPCLCKMAALGGWCKGLCRIGWLPICQPIRHRAKAITRHFKPMNIMRAKLMAVTEYIPPKPAIPKECIALDDITVNEEDGFTRVLLREVKQTFLENKMIVVFQYNYIHGKDMVILRHRLRKYNIHVKFFPNLVMKTFLLESKFKNLLPLFVGRTLLMVSQELRASEMLRVLRSVPPIIFLGACVEDTILSRKGFMEFAQLPSMDMAQREVVGALSLMTSQTSTLLQRGPVHLTSLLDQYIKQQNCKEDDTQETGSSDNSDTL